MKGTLTKRAFTATQAATAADLEYHHVNHWCRIGLIKPSIQAARGQDGMRVYSFADVVALRIVGCLHFGGLELRVLRGAAEYLQTRDYTEPLAGKRFLVGKNGFGVREVDSRGLKVLIGGSLVVWVIGINEQIESVTKSVPLLTDAPRGKASLIRKFDSILRA